MEDAKKPASTAKGAQQGAENKIIDLVDVVRPAPVKGERIIDLTDVVSKPGDGDIIELTDVVPAPDVPVMLAEDLFDLESDDIDFFDALDETDAAEEQAAVADLEPPAEIMSAIEASETFPPEDLEPTGTMNRLLDLDLSGMSNDPEQTEPTDTDDVREAIELSDDIKIVFDEEDTEPLEIETPPDEISDDDREPSSPDFIVLDDVTEDDLEEENKEEDDLFDSMGINIDPSHGSETFPDIPIHLLNDQPDLPDETDRGDRVSRRDLEAAVEAVLQRTFTEKIERIITEVIEKAVRKEIDALKKALSDEMDTDR